MSLCHQIFEKTDIVMKRGKYPAPVATCATIVTSLVLSLLGSSYAVAEQPFKIGIAAPLSGSFAPLGKQLIQGAQSAAAGERIDPQSDLQTELTIADDSCTAEGGKAAAEAFLQAQVKIVTGFLCSEALEAAWPSLVEHNIPIIISGVRELTLSEKRNSGPKPLFRLASGLDKQAEAAGNILASLWRDLPFAIIDDGTIEGRELAARVLTQLRDKQLQPVFTDTYRPGLDNQNALVGRLRRAGATQLFVGGQRDDVAAIERSIKALKYPMSIAGGDMLQAAGAASDLSVGTLMIAVPEPQTLPTAAATVSAMQAAGQLTEGYVITGFASVQLAQNALKAAQDQKQPLIDILRTNAFETVLGTIRFNEHGERIDNPNRLQRYDGQRFVIVDK